MRTSAIMKIIALTAPVCPKCKSTVPKVRELCENSGVQFFTVDALTEGRHLVNSHRITSVPAFLIYDDKDVCTSVLVGEDAYHDIKSILT